MVVELLRGGADKLRLDGQIMVEWSHDRALRSHSITIFFFFEFARLTTKEVLTEHTLEKKSRERKRKVKERKKVKVMNERNIPHIRRTCPGHVSR